MPAEDMTFKAVWEINTYEIVFDSNDVSVKNGETVLKSGDKVSYGTKLTVSAVDHEGYTAGKVKANGTETESEYEVFGDVEFTVDYTKNSYNVKFVDGDNVLYEGEVKYGDKIAAPADPSKTGYTFKGWNPEVPENMPAEDMTFKAVWEINKYTVTFDNDGKTNDVEVEYGNSVAKPEGPEKEGYTFVAWYLDGKAYDFETPVTGDITLVAMYSPTIPESGKAEVKVDGDNADFVVPEEKDKNILVSGKTDGKEWNVTLPTTEFAGKTVKVVVREIDPSVLSPALRDKIGNMPVFQLELYVDGVLTTEFSESILVELPYVLGAGIDASDLRAGYITSDNELKVVDSKYDDGFVVFETNHFSYWTLAVVEETSTSYANLTISLGIALVIAIVAVLSSYWMEVRRKA